MSLTRLDLKLIGEVIDKKFDEKFDQKISPLKQELVEYIDSTLDRRFTAFEEKIEARISLLPTKEEFYDMMDVVLTRYKKIDQEHDVLAGQVSRHSKEILQLQKKAGISPSLMP